jgi:hypothetical protein
MRRRLILAIGLELLLVALVAGMFALSIHFARQEKAWADQGMAIGPAAQVMVDVSMWWLKYWWTTVPLIVLGGAGMAAVIVFAGRPGSPGQAAAAR